MIKSIYLEESLYLLPWVAFMAFPFGLAAANGIPVIYQRVLKNAVPHLLTFSIQGICENLSFMPIIGSGALYMA